MSPDRLYRVMRMLGTSPRGFIWRMHRSSSVYAIFLVQMPRQNGIRICTRMHPRCSPLTYGPAFIPGTDGGRPRAACLELRLRRFRAACRDGVGSEDGQRRHVRVSCRSPAATRCLGGRRRATIAIAARDRDMAEPKRLASSSGLPRSNVSDKRTHAPEASRRSLRRRTSNIVTVARRPRTNGDRRFSFDDRDLKPA